MSLVRRLGAMAVTFVLAAGVLGACSADDIESTSASEGGGGAAAIEAEVEQLGAPAKDAYTAYGAADVAQTSTGSVARSTASRSGEAADIDIAAPEAGPDVIKTADLELEIERDGLQQAVREAVSTAGRFGGFVLSTTTEGQGAGSGSVVIRVPAERFEAALAALEGLGKVESETVSGQDVSQEFVDLEARVRNLKAQETVLLRLMERAQTVTDTIRVQNELSGIQLEIERLTGRIRFLRDQADTSTISLHLYEAGAAPGETPKAGVLAKAFDRAVNLALGVVSTVIVGTGLLIPLLFLALLAYLVLRALRPRVSL